MDLQRSPFSAVDRGDVETSLVECLMLGLPDLNDLDGISLALADLVQADIIRILDLVCVGRSEDDARVRILELHEVRSLDVLSEVEGQVGGWLSERDIRSAALLVEPGAAAVLLLVEDRWARVLARASRRVGGSIVGGERISPTRVAAAMAGPEGTAVLGEVRVDQSEGR